MRVFLATFLLGLATASQLPSETINLYGSDSFRASQYATPYAWRGWNRYLTTRDLFEKPIFVLAPSSQHPSQLTVHYLHNGLRSVSTDRAFETLHHYMKSSDLTGIIFFPRGIYNAHLFQTLVDGLVLPENFKVNDFLKSVAVHEDQPIVYFVPKAQLEEFHFENVTPLVSIAVYDDIVEPIRVETLVKRPTETTIPEKKSSA